MKNLLTALKTSALIILTAIMAFAVSGPAAADDDFYGPGLWHKEGVHKTFYGAYLTIDGKPSYCLDAGLPSPRPQHFKGAEPTSVRTPQTAWLLAEYADSKDSSRQAALSAFVKLDKALPHRHTMKVRTPKELGKKFAKAADMFTQMRKDAKDFAGPYTLTLAPKHRDGKVFATPTLTSAAGKELDWPVDVVMTGGSEDLRKQVPAGTEVSVSAPPGALVSVEATAAGLPSTDVLVYKPTDGKRVQNVTTGVPAKVTAKATANTQLPFAPTAETTAEVSSDGSITDTVNITGAPPNSTLSVIARAYHSDSEPVQSAEPQGTLVDEQELTARIDGDGKAQLTTEAVEGKPGWTTWTVEILESERSDGWVSDWGIPEETVYWEEPPEPTPPPKEPTPSEEPTPSDTPTPEEASTPKETPSAPPEQPEPKPESTPEAGGEETPTPQEPKQAETLPRTGADWRVGAGMGLVLLGIGAAAVGFTRKRS
ncbi:hypothetical protein [Brevibacterium sp. HMSC22B09]|uniref:hypothetical protein n=1 Tax=Brevibacterium sp. HMSC22B09 TaxID=1581055 RepID=UPI000AFFEC78|nr:hypothetical protein [Brevibacterium sp. HMSC22B09]